MKNLYKLLLLAMLVVSNYAVGQRIETYPAMERPTTLHFRQNNIVPFIGFSVALPLSKRHKQDKQARKLIPEPSISPVTMNEDGPIAWTYTGQEVTIYVGGGSTSSSGYYWDGGVWSYWSVQYNEMLPPGDTGPQWIYEEPPRVLKSARKVPKNHCDNNKTVFKNMWDRQQAMNREQVAFVTDKGIVWLDDSNNTATFSETGYAYEYGGYPGGKFFIVDGVVHTITAIVHTHPNGAALSNLDMGLASTFGVPIYAIGQDGISKGMPNGSGSMVDYNRDNAFDCGIATGIFGL